MIVTFNGKMIEIPKGYKGPDEYGLYKNGHGVEYALVQYGHGEDAEVCLETVYSRHVRTVRLKVVTPTDESRTVTGRNPEMGRWKPQKGETTWK